MSYHFSVKSGVTPTQPCGVILHFGDAKRVADIEAILSQLKVNTAFRNYHQNPKVSALRLVQPSQKILNSCQT